MHPEMRVTTDGTHLPQHPPPRDAGFCPYCGSPLDPIFYFCTTCAMPYKSAESVVSPSRPMQLTMGNLIARKAPGVPTLFWTYFSVIVAVSVLGQTLFPHDRPDLVLLLQTIVLFVVTCVFAALHWPSLAVQFKRFGFQKPEALLALLALIPLLGLNYLYHGWLIHSMDLESPMLLDRLRELGLADVSLILLYCAFPALVEEVSFRGLLQQWLMVAITPRQALILTAALFTVLHFSIYSAPYLFLVGLLLGWTRWRTGSLYPPMLVHFLHNFVVAEFFFR